MTLLHVAPASPLPLHLPLVARVLHAAGDRSSADSPFNLCCCLFSQLQFPFPLCIPIPVAISISICLPSSQFPLPCSHFHAAFHAGHNLIIPPIKVCKKQFIIIAVAAPHCSVIAAQVLTAIKCQFPLLLLHLLLISPLFVLSAVHAGAAFSLAFVSHASSALNAHRAAQCAHIEMASPSRTI